MKYEINTNCIINTANPTPSINGREIAINILPADKKAKKKFENFVLAIDGHPQCCEYYGSGAIIVGGKYKGKDIGELPEAPIYVKSIEVEYEIKEEEWTTLDLEAKGLDEEIDCRFVKIETKEYGDIIAYVFNQHNGYYSHYIHYSNQELKLDVFEEDYI